MTDIAARVEALRHSLLADPPKRLLVLCREHIGDLVNTTAGIWALRQNFPSVHLVVEVGERAISVLENFPGIDEIWPRPTHQGLMRKMQRLKQMRAAGFDLCVILDDSNSMVQWARWAKIPRVAGVWRGVKHEGLFDAYARLAEEMHEVRDHNRALIELMGLDVSDFRPRLFPSSNDLHVVHLALRKSGIDGPFVAIHPGASEAARRWPAERFGEVARRLIEDGHSVLVLGGPGEEALVEDVLSACGGRAMRLKRKLSVVQLAALLSKASLLICNDTGPMHIAGAMGTRVVGLFGVTNPSHTGPYGEGHSLIRGSCPCSPRSLNNCSGECMRSISVEQVVEAARSQLSTKVES